jgi:hypothetical protein
MGQEEENDLSESMTDNKPPSATQHRRLFATPCPQSMARRRLVEGILTFLVGEWQRLTLLTIGSKCLNAENIQDTFEIVTRAQEMKLSPHLEEPPNQKMRPATPDLQRAKRMFR